MVRTTGKGSQRLGEGPAEKRGLGCSLPEGSGRKEILTFKVFWSWPWVRLQKICKPVVYTQPSIVSEIKNKDNEVSEIKNKDNQHKAPPCVILQSVVCSRSDRCFL